jgi:hypothetical protein
MKQTESGDLLEAYRDSVYPARGRGRADLWFVRQVAGYVVRSSAGWGVLFGLLWVIGPFRMLVHMDGFADLEQKVIATMVFLLAARRAWRSEQIRAGILWALSAAVVGSLIWIFGAVIQAARWDLSIGWIRSLRQNLDWSVFVMIPALSLTGALILGTLGASAGRLLQVSLKRTAV